MAFVDRIQPLTADDRRTVLANLGLVRKQADRMSRWLASRYRKFRLDHARQYYEDLYASGIIGLCVASKLHDPSLGFKFSTYAWACIRSWITNAVRLVPLIKYHRPRVIRFSELDHNDSHGETGERHSQPLDVWDSRDKAHDDSLPRPELLALMSLVLTPREVRIVAMRVFDNLYLDQIGQREGCTKERIRQLLARALMKLRTEPAFVNALNRQAWRRRQELNADDFRDTGIATLIA